MDGWDKFYQTVVDETQKGVWERLDRFRISLGDWFWPTINWPPPDWRDELYLFVQHTRYYGLIIEQDAIDRFRYLIEARVNGTGPFVELGPYHFDQPPAATGAQVQLAMGVALDDGTRTGATVAMDAPASALPPDDGFERAGPGPEVSASFKAKVQIALELLDPRVARWWKAPSVEGQVRSRDARFWQYSYYSEVSKTGQPFIYVDQDFTAGQTAEATIAEINRTQSAGSIGAAYRKYKFHQKLDPTEFQEWQKGATKEAAWFAGFMAELYVNGIATITPAGDLVVTIGDIADNGLRWDQLISALPIIGKLPIGALVIKVGRRQIKLSKKLASKLRLLGEADRKAPMSLAAAAKTDDEAAAILRREIARHAGTRQIHHPISKPVHEALKEHRKLKGKYKLRDSRFELLAKDYESHHGYQDWHRKIDAEVVDWLNRNDEATEATFETWLKWRYSQDDLIERFPEGL
jgi:hypothetical protein